MENQGKKPHIYAQWSFPEVEDAQKSRRWYIFAGVIAVGCLVFAFFTANTLFAAIIVMASFIYIYSSISSTMDIMFSISEIGVQAGSRFYPYKDIKSFWLLYEPQENLKMLYFEFKRGARSSMSVPLKETNPLEVREVLLQFIPEDLEKEEEPLPDMITRLFKL